MCFIYFLNYLDNQTLNYANAYGLKTDLGLVGNDCGCNKNWLSVVLHTLPIGKFVAGNLMLWGAGKRVQGRNDQFVVIEVTSYLSNQSSINLTRK